MTRLPMTPDATFFPLHGLVVHDGILCRVAERSLISGRPAGRYTYRISDFAGQTASVLGADLRNPTADDLTFASIVADDTAALMPRVVLVDRVDDVLVQVIECVLPPVNDDSPPERGVQYQAIVGDPDLCPARTLPDGSREQGCARGGRIVGASTSSAEHALTRARRLIGTTR
jgi:hypothetical protein